MANPWLEGPGFGQRRRYEVSRPCLLGTAKPGRRTHCGGPLLSFSDCFFRFPVVPRRRFGGHFGGEFLIVNPTELVEIEQFLDPLVGFAPELPGQQ